MESSYCYFIKQESQSNESLNKRDSETAFDNTNDQDESTSKSDSSASSSIKSKIEDETINDINTLKKNLYNEEEFRSINHSEPIHIFLKIKPLSIQEIVKQKDEKYYVFHADTGVSVIPPKTSVYSQNKQSAQNLMQTIFHFSYVFQQKITQKDFFMATIYPCFEKFFNGDNLLIFNYGVTNSGKTYTMQGTHTDPGLIPRSLDFLFESLKESSTSWENSSIDLGSNSVYKYKPDKFNEISLLSDTELSQELMLKESILRLTNTKELERYDSMRDLSSLGVSSLEASKKFGSLDSLSTIANSIDSSNENNTAYMLNKIKLPPTKRYAVWLSFYELYNDSIYDLLTVPTSKYKNTLASGERPQLKIREDTNRIPYVEGLTHVPVFNTREAIRILKYGEKNLQKSNNSINANSSRSHAVFCLKIVSIDCNNKNHLVASINQLSFCDLAGIERNSKTQAVGKTQKEASFINQSLSSLSRCINTMMYNQKNKNNPQQIPYRVNKLTRLFQAYFEGKSMVKMIVNFNPSVTCFDESVGVLKFSSIANQIQLTLTDEKKVEYKIDINTNTPSKNSQTVAWESDCDDDDDEEDDEDCSEEEDSEEDDEDDEDEDEEEESEEEEETEEETKCQESCEEEDEDEEDETEEESVEADEDDEDDDEEESSEECDETSEEDDEDEEDEDEEEDENEDEEDDNDDDEEEEESEEENIKNKTHNTTVKKTVKIEKSINFNKSSSKYKPSKTFQKTPSAKKVLKKLNATDTKCLEKKIKLHHKSINKTISKANMSQLRSSSKFDELSKDQLISLCKTMKKDIDKAKIEYTKYESNLRSELVSTWSKRVEDTDTYYQEQIKMQRTQVEETYLKRIEMLEKLLNKKADERLDQFKKDKENEIEKLKEQLTNSNAQIKSLIEENLKLKEETDNLIKLNDDLNEKLKEKIAEYDAIVDKNNYLTTNLLNSTAINLSIIQPSNKVVSSEKMNVIGEETTQNETEMSISDEDQDDDDDEEEDDEEEESVEQTGVTEQTEQETESDDEEDEEETEEEETEMEETQSEETKQSDETSQIEKSTVKPTKVFTHQESQTEVVQTKSIEVEANMPNEELEKIKIVFDLKVIEITTLTEKIKSVENLNNQLNKVLKSKNQQETDLNMKIKQLEKDLLDSETSNKANEDQIKSLLAQKQQQTELYDKLEIEYNKLMHSLEESDKTVKRLEMKIVDLEKDAQQLKNEIADNKININELTKELNDKKTKLEKNIIQIDELEKAITKLSDDLKKKSFSYELLENDLQFKQNQIDKLTNELEETKASKVKLEEYNSIAAKRPSTTEVKEEPIERMVAESVSRTSEVKSVKSSSSKLSIKSEKIDMSTMSSSSLVTAKLPKKKSSLSKKSTDLKSIPELKKSKKSKDRASSINFNQGDDNEEQTDSKSKSSKTIKSSKTSKKLKEEDVSDSESVMTEKESKKKAKDSVDKDEVNTTNLSNTSMNLATKPTCNLTKKKSTLNRLTEMIAKSPILEPLRKRPQRQANLKASASNASETTASLSILQNSTNNTSKTATLDNKSKVKKTSASKIIKVEDGENTNPEVAEVETGRKTRKKKA